MYAASGVAATKAISSPRKLRPRVEKSSRANDILAELFEIDFDSDNPSELIQFKRNWQYWKKSRRLQQLSPAKSKLQSPAAPPKTVLPTHLSLPMQEVIVDGNTRVYQTPRCGWNSMIRRVIQYGYIKMGQPAERDEFHNNNWRGPNGVIDALQLS